MNAASVALLRELDERIERSQARLDTEADPVKRAVHQGWVDAMLLTRLDVARAIPAIEAAAFLVPSDEPEAWAVA